ncbi:MAG TPA: YihY/virulence factor BrkB family protein [Ferruginibacter sp.]|nr:YihY/virulence factor BrkB family protein [Ferruginibacter sp.]
MDKKISFKGIVEIFKNAFKGFSDNKITKLSGSLAYSVIFSLGPLFIVIISLCSLFLGRDAIEGKIYSSLASFVGSDTAVQLQDIIKNANLSGKSEIAITIGIISLLIGATSIFGEIQDSINTIWGVRSKPKKGWVKFLENRFLSFSIIVALGFLLLVSLGVNSIIDVFSAQLKAHFPDIAFVVVYTINVAITFIVTTSIFAVIFKVLPDAIIHWKDVFAGALATTLFFMLGKFAISFYIRKGHVGSTYGAAGSLIVILLWVYYSSIILYFGAELTKAYAVKYGSAIHPNEYAVTTKLVEVENNTATNK